jgi:hypothetical protein
MTATLIAILTFLISLGCPKPISHGLRGHRCCRIDSRGGFFLFSFFALVLIGFACTSSAMPGVWGVGFCITRCRTLV